MLGEWARRTLRWMVVGLAISGLLASPATAQTSTTYVYDALGRVKEAVENPSGRKVVYQYDDAGNRTQVGNGVTYTEILPTAFSASSTYSVAAGLSTANGMKDGVFDSRPSIHVSDPQANPWVQADFGTAKNIDHLDVAPAKDVAWAIGVQNLNTAKVEYSQNGTTWTAVATVNGAVLGNYLSLRLGGVSARYVRLRRPTYGQIAVGDLRFFSSADTSNMPPLAVNDVAISNGGAPVLVDALANDSDQENQPLSITAYTQPSAGTVTLNSGQLTYTAPNSSYAGSTSFTYTISDSQGATATASVAVTAYATANAPPTAVDDNLSLPAYTSATFDPRTNDSDPNSNPLTITGVGSTSHGVANVNNGTSVTYTPTAGYVGWDSFAYTISDGRGGTAMANVGVTVTTGNQAMLRVMQPSTYSNHVNISGATFNVASNGMVNVYVDRPMGVGKWYWEVKVLCGVLMAGVSSNINTAQAHGGYSSYNAGINTYNPVAWPTATPAGPWGWGSIVTGDILGFAFDADAKVLKIYKNNALGPTISSYFNPPPYYAFSGVQPGYTASGQSCADTSAKGEFRFGAGNTAYTPPTGYNHLFQYSSNNPPTAANDSRMTLPNTALSVDPRVNDFDPEGDALSLTTVSTPGHGTASLVGSTSITYTPTNGYTGPDSFTYTVSDGRGGFTTANVTVTVTSGALARGFSISPAVNGKTTWALDVDGPLILTTAGSWTIVPNSTFAMGAKAWGAGGGGGGVYPGGGGGYATGTVTLSSGVSHVLYVGAGGQNGAYSYSEITVAPAGGAPGGGDGSTGGTGPYYAGGGGGGYSGIRKTSGQPILMAGAGGGSSTSNFMAAGGGTTGESVYAGLGGGGGTQSAGGAGYNGGASGGAYYGGSGGEGSGGGGGGGRYGGGGAGYGYSGGGGSGFLDGAAVTNGTLTTGSGNLPANNYDTERGDAGGGGSATSAGRAGRLRLW